MLGGSALAALRRPVIRPTWLTPSRRPVAGSILSVLYGQAVLIVTGVILARALGPNDRGYLAFLLLLESVVRQVGGFGLPASTTYFVARNRDTAYAVVRTMRVPALLQATLLTLAQACLLWILVADKPEDVWIAGLFTLGLLPSSLATEYGLAILQGQGRYQAFNFLRALPVTGYGVVLAILFAIDEIELIAVSVAIVVVTATCAFVILVVARRGVRSAGNTPDSPSRSQIFRFGIKGYLGGLSPVETFRLDQAAIGLFLRPADLGLYVVALSITNLPRFIAQSVGAIAFPRAAQDVDGYRTMWRFTLFAAALTGAITVALELMAGWLVPFFFGSDFADAVGVTRILLVGALFYSIRRVLADGAKGIGAPGLGSIAELVSWISLLPLLVILMPTFGLSGVAAAIAFSSGLSLVFLLVALLRRPATSDARASAERVEASSHSVDAGLLGGDS